MKAGQFQVVRWVSKLVTGKPGRKSQDGCAGLRELDAQQLRQVAGGTSTPNKTW
jgi:hypothetical protein